MRVYDKEYFEAHGFDFAKDVERFYPLALTLKSLGCRRVLDLGCAYGALVYVLRKLGIEAYGIDVSRWVKETSIVSNYIILRNMECEKMPFKDKYFDCITAINFFEHVRNLKHCIRECYRVVRSHGFIYASIPCVKESVKDPYHVSILPLREWIKVFYTNGFKLSFTLFVRFWLNFTLVRLKLKLGRKRTRHLQAKAERSISPDRFLMRFLIYLSQSYRLILTKHEHGSK